MSGYKKETMKAVRWEGKPFSVSVRDVPIPKIQHPLDAIIRITTSAICGSDLHAYNGRLTMESQTLGHENIGIVVEVGSDVTVIKKGDRVVVNADLEESLDNADTEDRGILGISIPGLFPKRDGGQAEFLRVPWAETNCLIVPPGREHELDYLLLADIWPTAWWALDRAEQVFGDTVVVFGAGPVGLLCAYSAILRGAVRVYSVDHVPERLEKARSIGAIPINFAECDPVKEILKHEPEGVDRSCECVGYECVDAKGKNVENLTIKWAIAVTRPYGGIGLIGVFAPKNLDPKDTDGLLSFPAGDFFLKSLSLRTGIVDTRRFQDTLLRMINSGKAKPSFVFDAKYELEDADEAYRDFAKHRIIKPYFRVEKRHRDYSSSPERRGEISEHERNGHGNGSRKRHRDDSSDDESDRRERRLRATRGSGHGHFHSYGGYPRFGRPTYRI